MKIGFKTSQTNVDWPTLVATWELADERPILDSGWLFDHFVALGEDGGGSHEAFTMLAALAARTKRLQLGHLVLSNTYRHPALTAKSAATIDHIAPGRFVLGLGAGWHEGEHAMYGLPLPPIGERITMLESAVRLIRAMWDSPEGATLDAPPYRLENAVCDPPPVTPGGPPIWLGTQGMQRGLGIVARFADGWNHTGEPESFEPKRDALLRHCEAAGRDSAEIEISAQVFGRFGARAQREAAASYGRAGASHLILVMGPGPSPDGLEQLIREVVQPLRDEFGTSPRS
jgi:alkanesulfonate monooxygenase SsuD/methylene tetrahydromethanopterin reductase-like flavin-dependent oxidoreductase (luciferase family)